MRILDNLELTRNQKKQKKKKLLIALGIISIFLLGLFYWLLSRSGYWLIQDNAFNHVSWAVVLDGQTAELERTDYVSKLMEKGKVDSVLVLGRRVYRDKNNADFYAEDMMRTETLDSGAVFLWRHNDPSTLEEAISIIPWFKKKNADTVLLITSAPASRRVAYIFNYLAEGSPTFITTDIKHYTYNPASWLREREIRKLWFREMLAALQAKWDLFWITPREVLQKEVREVVSLREENKEVLKAEKEKRVEEKPLVVEQSLDTLKTDSVKVGQ